MSNDSFRRKSPELLRDLADQVKSVLMEYGDERADRAEVLGIEVAERISKSWGGSIIYMPLGTAIGRHKKAIEVWEEYNGYNTKALARKHGVSEQWIYKVIRMMRKEDRRQGDLFDGGYEDEPVN